MHIAFTQSDASFYVSCQNIIYNIYLTFIPRLVEFHGKLFTYKLNCIFALLYFLNFCVNTDKQI